LEEEEVSEDLVQIHSICSSSRHQHNGANHHKVINQVGFQLEWDRQISLGKSMVVVLWGKEWQGLVDTTHQPSEILMALLD